MNQTIGRLIKLASNELAREMNEFASKYNLTGMQMSIIDFLGHFPGNSCDQQQIEKEFGVKRSTTTVMLQRMAKRGLITRTPSVKDRRQKIVSLTADGKRMIPTVSNYIGQSEQKILTGLSEEDEVRLKQVLQLIIGMEDNKDE